MRKQAKVQNVKDEKESGKRMRKNDDEDEGDDNTTVSRGNSKGGTPIKSKKRTAMVGTFFFGGFINSHHCLHF